MTPEEEISQNQKRSQAMEDDIPDHVQRHVQRSWTSMDSLFYPSSILIIIIILFLGTWEYNEASPQAHHQKPVNTIALAKSTQNTEERPCGTNAISARSNGCNFDPLTFAWLPPRCYDYNLTAEFLALQDWEWYRARSDGTKRRLSLVNIMQGGDDQIYVSWEYHRQHCSYMYLKMHRAMMSSNEKWVDGVTMWDIIPEVCDRVLRNDRPLNDTSVPGYVRYPSCRQY